MAPTANAVKPSGDISLSDANSPTSPSKTEAGYNLRSGLKAILSTPALKHPIADISLSDATLEGSGLFADADVTALPSKEQVSESVSRTVEKTKEKAAASPVKNKSEKVLDSARKNAASTADTVKSTAGSALHSVEDKTSETYAYAKRRAEESLDYAKHMAGDGIKYAKQKTGLAEEPVSSKAHENLKEMKEGVESGATYGVSDTARHAQKRAKSTGPSSSESPIIKEHAGVLESLAGSAMSLAEKLGHAIHHPLGGTHATGAPMSTPITVLPSSPKKSAPSVSKSSVPDIPSTSGQKVHIGADMKDEEIVLA